jgi:hypothetical protein
MTTELASELSDRGTSGKSVTDDNRHLLQLLFSASTRFAESTAELEAEFGPLDFSADLPERIAAEFGLDMNEAWLDACGIRGARAYAEHHREEIIAQATAKGLL